MPHAPTNLSRHAHRRVRPRTPPAARRVGGPPGRQDHPRANLPPAQLQPALQPEQHGGDGRDRHRDHRHRRRRLEGHARAVRRHAHRQEPVPHRGDLAGDRTSPGSTRQGARRRTRSARSTSRCGTSRARRSAFPSTSCSAAWRATTASATPRAARGLAGVRPAQADQPQGARPRDDGGRVSRVPHGRGRRADWRRLRHAHRRPPDRAGLPRRARGCRRRRQLVHRPPPAVRFQRRGARLQGHGTLRAVLRRGSGARRACAAGHPQAAADDQRAARRTARSGACAGTSTGSSRATTSTSSARRCRTSAASPR